MRIWSILLLSCFIIFVFSVIILLRIVYILPIKGHSKKATTNPNAHLMILLGSGGHTGEMIRLLKGFDLTKYAIRSWVFNPEDRISATKAIELDRIISKGMGKCQTFEVPRARDIGQSWLSTIASSSTSLLACVKIVLTKPNVILTNGPGTSVVLCGTAFALKFLGISSTRIIYVESLARVNHLSLSGKLLYPIADRFIVQWPQLQRKYPRSEYYGILV